MVVHNSNEERFLGLSGLKRQLSRRVFIVSTNSLFMDEGKYRHWHRHQNVLFIERVVITGEKGVYEGREWCRRADPGETGKFSLSASPVAFPPREARSTLGRRRCLLPSRSGR